MTPQEQALLMQQKLRSGTFQAPASFAAGHQASGESWKAEAEQAVIAEKMREYADAAESGVEPPAPANRLEAKAYENIYGTPPPMGQIRIEQIGVAPPTQQPGPISIAPGPAQLPPSRPTEKPTDEPSGPTIPGMASVKGKIGKLERDLGAFRTEQKAGFEAERKEFEAEEQRVEQESEVAFARGKMKNAEGALNTATEKLATWEINPQRAFPDAFSKIAAVISVAMGAYAQGLSGGKIPNTALQIVNSAIDRDIDAQKMEYQKLKGLVDEKRNVYGMAMRLLGDERQADELARSAAYRSFNAQMTSLAKQYGIDEAVFRDRLGALNLEEKENFHRASLMQAALKGSTDKDSKSSKVLKQAVVAQTAIRQFREIWKKHTVLDVFGQFVPWAKTDAALITQKRGLLAKQLLRLTENGRISNEDFEIMLKYVPGVNDGPEKGEMYLNSLEESMNAVIAAEWPDIPADKRRAFLEGQAKRAGVSETDIVRPGEGDETHSYWKDKFGSEKVEG